MSDKFIPLSVPNLKGNELKYVTTAVETEWVSTGGPYVTEFEEKTAAYVGTKGAVSCQSGTAGLHTALLLTGVTKEDEVIVPALTFIAAVNPVKYIGAEPVFMDCDDSLCMSPDKLEKFCREECDFSEGKLMNRKTKRYIKAMVVVHVFGNMADMERIMEIAQKYNIYVVEDATEALGTYYTEGKYKGKFAGTIADMGVYSFNGNKIITTGGGGMLVSDHEEYLERARHLTTQAKSDVLYYTHDEIGYNYRMTNLQAALGLGQLEQLEAFIKVKEENYNLYQERVRDIAGLELLPFREGIRSNKWFYGLDCSHFTMGRDELIQHLAKNQIQTRPIWGLINQQKPYLTNQAYEVEKAVMYWKNIVNIPCSTSLTEEEVIRVVEVLMHCKDKKVD